VILGKAGHGAKWNKKALPPAANKHTFLKMHIFPILSSFQVMYSYRDAEVLIAAKAVSLCDFCFFYA